MGAMDDEHRRPQSIEFLQLGGVASFYTSLLGGSPQDCKSLITIVNNNGY